MRMAWLLSIVLLPGCIGKKHQIPSHHFPKSYQYRGTANSCPAQLANWWYTFEDDHLNKLIDTAVGNNYDLAIAVEKIFQARALYQLERAQLMPEIDGIAQVNRTRFSTVVAQNSFIQNIKNPQSFYQLGFDGSWEIDFWGKIWRAKKAAYFELQAQVEQMRDIYIILLADVARVYVRLCSLNAIYHTLLDQIKIYKELLCLQKDLFVSGIVSKIELTIRQQELAAVQEKVIRTALEREQAKNQLAVLLGSNPESIMVPDRATVPLSDVQLATGMPSELIRRRPDIRQKERELAASNELVGQAIAEWFPSFSLLGGLASASSNASNWFIGKSLFWTIGPSVNWPLINFGRIKANIKVKESANRQAALAYSQSIIMALKDVEDALVGYFQTKHQYSVNTVKHRQAFIQQELDKSRFQAGLSSKVAYLESMINRIGVDVEQITIQQEISTNLIALYKALGGGW